MAPADNLRNAIRDAIIAALADRQDELTAIAEAGGAKAGGGLLGDVGTLSGVIGDVLTALLVFDPPAELALQVVQAAEGQAGHLGSGFGVGYMLGYAGWQMFQPAILPLQYKIATVFQTQQMDADVSADWVAKGILALQDGRNKAHEVNVADDDFDNMADAAEQRPDTATLLELLNRQEVQEADVIKAFQRHGLNPFWHAPLLSLRRQLLSGADLALANLRGVIDDTTMQGYADQLGITPDDMQVLIDNTGEPPGIMEMLFLYRRKLIDEPTLTRAILQSRIRNEWIQAILDLRYQPMSTADAARAVVEGYMSDADGADIAQQNGLTPEHWPFIVESWGRPLSHEQMLTLYHRGQATLDQVVQAMKESDIKDKYIDQAIELGRTLIPERQLVSMIQHEVIDKPTGLELLKERGYTEQDAEYMIALGSAQRTNAHKVLSRSDILTMYADSLMSRTDAQKQLVALGYSAVDAGQMLDLADYKHKATQLKVLERGIEAELKAGRIDDKAALAQLTTAGLDHNQAQILVDTWQQERKVASRTLTEPQIMKARGYNAITAADAIVRLSALGYGPVDIGVLFVINGFTPQGEVPPPTPTTTTA